MSPKSAMKSKCNGKKKKNAPEQCAPPKATDVNSASGLDPEMEDRFELELCWCIQRLEANLTNGKLQEKQAQELSKYLHLLKSSTAPLVKKRQIMRSTLGDYREKMAENERKLSKIVSTVKFTNSATINRKSVFIKKATRCGAQKLEEQADDHKLENPSINTKRTVININRIQTPFRFNF